ncbi:ADP-ribosyltransferase domain-containing protein [Streptomyces sp. TRM75561]|uniref:ADP-ribosyltransferase n=1 Tax=Streptomyces sp. TRM75561 TaxID=2975269 RepID=UPI002447167A|nr:ADP-ribosyltransferase domain-containing protein [Streptomyces sp. TRM75561]MDH3039090.1 ADP-ribosyltransferase domain-containing protein [Streptomyces sp. TRM75561]
MPDVNKVCFVADADTARKIRQYTDKVTQLKALIEYYTQKEAAEQRTSASPDRGVFQRTFGPDEISLHGPAEPPPALTRDAGELSAAKTAAAVAGETAHELRNIAESTGHVTGTNRLAAPAQAEPTPMFTADDAPAPSQRVRPAPVYPIVDPAVRARWADRFAEAREVLESLPEAKREQLLEQAAQLMSGRHQPPPIDRAGAAEGSPEAEYAALFDDMAAVIAARVHSEPRPDSVEEWPPSLLSEELRTEFGTRAVTGLPGGMWPTSHSTASSSRQGQQSSSSARLDPSLLSYGKMGPEWQRRFSEERRALKSLPDGQTWLTAAAHLVARDHVAPPHLGSAMSAPEQAYQELYSGFVYVVAAQLHKDHARPHPQERAHALSLELGNTFGTLRSQVAPIRSARTQQWSEPAPGIDSGELIGDGRGFGAATGFAGVEDSSRAMKVARELIDVPAEVEQPLAARAEAARLIGLLLHDDVVAERVAGSGVRVVIVPRSRHLTDLPPYADTQGEDRPPVSARGWTDQQRAVVAVSEENLLGQEAADADRTHPEGYSSVLHEAAHLVYAFGLEDAKRTRVEEAFSTRRGAATPQQWVDGPLRDLYGNPSANHSSSDAAEYFAQSTVAYFGANHGRDAITHQQRNNGAAWLAEHDPVLNSLLHELYGPPPAKPLHANALSVTAADQSMWEAFDWHTTNTEGRPIREVGEGVSGPHEPTALMNEPPAGLPFPLPDPTPPTPLVAFLDAPHTDTSGSTRPGTETEGGSGRQGREVFDRHTESAEVREHAAGQSADGVETSAAPDPDLAEDTTAAIVTTPVDAWNALASRDSERANLLMVFTLSKLPPELDDMSTAVKKAYSELTRAETALPVEQQANLLAQLILAGTKYPVKGGAPFGDLFKKKKKTNNSGAGSSSETTTHLPANAAPHRPVVTGRELEFTDPARMQPQIPTVAVRTLVDRHQRFMGADYTFHADDGRMIDTRGFVLLPDGEQGSHRLASAPWGSEPVFLVRATWDEEFHKIVVREDGEFTGKSLQEFAELIGRNPSLAHIHPQMAIAVLVDGQDPSTVWNLARLTAFTTGRAVWFSSQRPALGTSPFNASHRAISMSGVKAARWAKILPQDWTGEAPERHMTVHPQRQIRDTDIRVDVVVDYETKRPIGVLSHSLEDTQKSEETFMTLSGYRQYAQGLVNRNEIPIIAGTERPVPWPRDAFFWVSHGQPGWVILEANLPTGGPYYVSGQEFGRYLRRLLRTQPLREGAPIVLVVCHGASVAQDVAQATGRVVYAADMRVGANFTVAKEPHGHDHLWMRFEPQRLPQHPSTGVITYPVIVSSASGEAVSKQALRTQLEKMTPGTVQHERVTRALASWEHADRKKAARAPLGTAAGDTQDDRSLMSARPRVTPQELPSWMTQLLSDLMRVPTHLTDDTLNLTETAEPTPQTSGFAARALGFRGEDGGIHLRYDGMVVSVPRHAAGPDTGFRQQQAMSSDAVAAHLLAVATRHLEKSRPEDFDALLARARRLMDGRHRPLALRDDLPEDELRRQETLRNIQLIVAHQLHLDRGSDEEARSHNALLVSEWFRKQFRTEHTDGFHVSAGGPLSDLFKREKRGFSSHSSGAGTSQTGTLTRPQDLSDTRFTWLDVTDWRRVGEQLGSNPGGTYLDQHGRQFYVKLSQTGDHARNEVLAAELYRISGVDVPALQLVTHRGRPGTASPIVEGARSDLQQRLKNDSDYRKAVQSGFAVDAWLANWDVAGAAFDNIVSSQHNHPVRIDTGGALLFRATGDPKGNSFGPQADEWKSLRDKRINPQSSWVFSDMSPRRMKDSAGRVVSVRPEQVDATVDALGFDPATGGRLKGVLRARRLDIAGRAGISISDTEGMSKAPEQILPAETGFYGNPSFQSSAEDRARFSGAFRLYDRYVPRVHELTASHRSLQGIPQEDLVALLGYTGNAYFDVINKGLREQDTELLERYDAHIRGVVSGLNRLPVHNGPVTRAIEIYTPSELKRVVARYKVGTTIEEKSFVSTDAVKVTRPGNVIFKIESLTGRRVDMLSEYQGTETEVLFPPGTRFHVTKNSKKGANYHISMVEVASVHAAPHPSRAPGTNTSTSFHQTAAQGPAREHTFTPWRGPAVTAPSASQALAMLNRTAAARQPSVQALSEQVGRMGPGVPRESEARTSTHPPVDQAATERWRGSFSWARHTVTGLAHREQLLASAAAIVANYHREPPAAQSGSSPHAQAHRDLHSDIVHVVAALLHTDRHLPQPAYRAAATAQRAADEFGTGRHSAASTSWHPQVFMTLTPPASDVARLQQDMLRKRLTELQAGSPEHRRVAKVLNTWTPEGAEPTTEDQGIRQPQTASSWQGLAHTKLPADRATGQRSAWKAPEQLPPASGGRATEPPAALVVPLPDPTPPTPLVAFLDAPHTDKSRSTPQPASSAPEHAQVVRNPVRTDTREASTTEGAAPDNAPSAVHSTDELLAGIEDKFRPAVRLWNGPFVTEAERLARILRVAGSRSLVFGIRSDGPMWAVNDGGSIVWRAKDTTVLPAPQEAVGPVASIDIHRDGYLIGPAASAVQKGTVGFCDLNLGADPYKVLGGR